MAWTEQDYQEIVARLMANSIGVNEVPNADKADDVTSLPAFKPSGSNSEASVVNYPLEFLKGEKGEPGIQGEPGKSFKVAGEYDTLEALKSAVPDGSAVDGFMAVGTEAPYDYYAWVSSAGGNNPDPSPDGKYLLLSDDTPLLLANEEPILLADNGERVASNGEWVNQGKIGGIEEAPTDGKAYGRKNGDWAEVSEHLNLTSENLNDINGAGFATQRSTADYTSPENNYPINENGALIFANANYGHSNQIYGSYLTNRWFARGGGNQQGVRTNWKEFAFTDDVLTKTNTSSFTPTGDYQPATKKYADNIGYGKVIDADSGTISNDLTGKGLNLTGVDAEERVNRYFGNLGNFRSVVQDIIENHTRYFIHNSNDCRELGCLNVWKNTGNTEHELHFILTGFGDGNLHTKRYSIRITENTDDARFIIVNIINSDNLTTLTKKTAAEYDAIGSKDANTAYCVTD